MNFLLVYVAVMSGSLLGIGGVDIADKALQPIRDGLEPPIVVPLQQEIPWLTEQTIKEKKAWMKAHPEYKGSL